MLDTMDQLSYKCESCHFTSKSIALLDHHIVNEHLPHRKKNEDHLFYQQKKKKERLNQIENK